MRFIIHFILNMAAAAIAAWLLPGVGFTGLQAVFIATIVFGLLNTFVRPLVSLLTLPINVLTLGLFGIVLNALFVLLVAELVSGFVVAGFWWALAYSVVVAIVGSVLHLVEGRRA